MINEIYETADSVVATLEGHNSYRELRFRKTGEMTANGRERIEDVDEQYPTGLRDTLVESGYALQR